MTPLMFTWDGDAMVPLARFHNAANAQFTVGEAYRLDAIEERSARSHNHYFAALHELWLNLPERVALDYPTVEHLRKRALILTGYRNERAFVCASKAEAVRLAAFLRPVNEFAVISVHETTVVEWTAQSQAQRAMGKAKFQESKDAVLGFAADLVGVAAESEAA